MNRGSDCPCIVFSVNVNDGYSLGLRYLMDKNAADAVVLTAYSPPVSTRAFIATGWALA